MIPRPVGMAGVGVQDGGAGLAIAERLGITPGTAKLHVSAVLNRLRAANRTQAALR